LAARNFPAPRRLTLARYARDEGWWIPTPVVGSGAGERLRTISAASSRR
jgi:hypothetical protein